MNKYSYVLALFLVLSPCLGFGQQTKGILDEETINISGVDYRTGNAPVANLGAVGSVSVSGGFLGFGRDRKFVYGATPNYSSLKIKSIPKVTQEFTSKVSAGLQAKARADLTEKINAELKLEGKTVSENDIKFSYQIFYIENIPEIIAHLNESKDWRPVEFLRGERKKARFINQILVAVEYDKAGLLNLNGSAGISLEATNKADGEIELSGTSDNTNKVSFTGVIVGYTYQFPCWVKDKENNSVYIKSFEMDEYGVKDKCISGVKDPEDPILKI